MSETPRTPETEHSSEGMSALAKALQLSFMLLVAAMLVALAGFFLRSLFTVEQQEAGVVLRFGRVLSGPQGDHFPPGLHFTFPHPIDEKLRVPLTLQSVESRDFWYREADATARKTEREKVSDVLAPGRDGYTLTGDLGIVHSQWVLRYKVTDPVRYAFACGDGRDDYDAVREYLRALLNNAVVHAAASQPIDVPWAQRERFRSIVQDRLRERLAAYPVGVEVDSVVITELVPPRQTQEAFLAFSQAETESGTMRSEAEAYRSRTVSAARRDAARWRGEASAYRTQRENQVAADISQFRKYQEIFASGEGDPEILKRTLIEDRLREVWAQVDEKFVLPAAPDRQLRLQLSRQPEKPGEPQP